MIFTALQWFQVSQLPQVIKLSSLIYFIAKNKPLKSTHMTIPMYRVGDSAAITNSIKKPHSGIRYVFFVRAKSLHLCLTVCDPTDCSLPGSSVHGVLQARILEWVAMSSSKVFFSHTQWPPFIFFIQHLTYCTICQHYPSSPCQLD